MRTIGTIIWRFMVIFSFIVNIVLVVVLLLAGLFIFEIKNQVADPLIGGLHSTAAGLGDATIDWVIPVRDTIPVVLNIPLQTDTTVILTAPVPITVEALIDLPPILGQAMNDVPATVELTLPQGLALPVALDLNVPVNEDLDIALDVRAVIPLRETQLIDPINQLGLLFEPLSIGLWNLPDDFGEASEFAGQLLSGDKSLEQLLLSTDGSGFNGEEYDPWPGYSHTAGENYPLFTEAYPSGAQPSETGIVVTGGIPALDALLPHRQALYADGSSPQTHNQQAIQNLESDPNVNPATYNGTMADYYNNVQSGLPVEGQSPETNGEQTAPVDNNAQTESTPVPTIGGQTDSTGTSSGGSGIIPTPAN
jgi:hypothetical protein